MFEGISRYRGPYAGGALAILFYMKQADLDKQLQKVYLEGFGEDFVGFCNSVIPDYPVYEEYRDAVEQWPDCLENAMILYSGYQAEKIGPLDDAVKTMKRQELAGKRWFMLPTDEKDAAGVIAQRAFEGLSASKFTELSVGAAFSRRELAVAVVDKDFHFAVVLYTAQRFRMQR
jgi:hypothetical protein